MNEDEFISSVILEAESCIEEILTLYGTNLRSPLLEFMEGGKRLRPYLLACIVRMLNGDRKVAIKLAASIEMYHNATLIYDDIQDNSLIRRDKPTLYSLFGTGMALSYASVLRSSMAKPFSCIQEDKYLQVSQWINHAASLLAIGQYTEMSWSYRQNFHVSEETYLEMVANKTGALIGLAATFGGIASSFPDVQKLFNIGRNLGIGYQILDDINNIDGIQSYKKDKYSDIYEKKITLLVIFIIKQGGKDKTFLRENYTKKNLTETDVLDIANIFETSGAINYCRKIAAGHIQQSIDALNNLELTDPNFTHIFVNNIKEVFENS